MARKKKTLEPIDERLRKLLSEAVEASGMTHTAIAEAIGMSQNRVSTILRGDTPPASVGEIAMIASAIGVSVSALVGRAEAAV